jgi:hypothetical protein
MGEANKFVVLKGDDKAGWIKIGLVENVVFQRRAMPQADSASAGERLVPDHGEAGRIGIEKAAVLNHVGSFVSGSAAFCVFTSRKKRIMLIDSQAGLGLTAEDSSGAILIGITGQIKGFMKEKAGCR